MSALWSTKRVAQRFEVEPATVRAWVADGKLRPSARRPGPRGAWLFAEEDVLAFGALREREGPEPQLVGDVAAIIDAEVRKVRGRG